jgi:hypothetical protein
MSDAGTIHAVISAVCPLRDGTSLGKRGDSSTIIWTPSPGATTEQRAAAQAIVDGWDWSAEAEAAREEAREEAANPEWTAVRRALAEIESDAAAWEAIKDTASAAQTRAAFTKLVGHVTKVARYVGKI